MQDFTTILSPAGFLLDVSVVSPVGGTGTFGPQQVFPTLSGGGIALRGTGEHALSSLGTYLSGKQGTIRVTLTTGAAGADQAVCFLALSSTVMLGVALDANNQPYVILKDQDGTTVGQSNVLGGAIAVNTPLTVLFAWNAQGPVYGGLNAAVLFRDEIVSWSTQPPATWLHFVPTTLYVGTSLGNLSLGDFDGTIGIVQVSNEVTFNPPSGVAVSDSLSAVCSFSGTATMAAAATVSYQGEAALPGTSSVTAAADVTLL